MGTAEKLSRGDVAAAVATSRELGTEYDDAVAEALAGRLEQVIDARVAKRLAEVKQAPKGKRPSTGLDKHQAGMRLALMLVSIVAAVPLTLVPVVIAPEQGSATVAAVWLGIIVLNVVFIVSTRTRRG
ncbi:hypothetical protein J4H86_03860 [Spiractinospora alimapuensis]|uniref:hypothetical protein n=1 Tax=Spiractinospora alimapuensis TaxID=2820884 RepID=UPI001F34825C|nr:hypothetical protein [Spiractinospora alimapuensis]QVQ52960.1 hypothetical protein J4H86_03860 [Spiractinospora alimapuensis]